MTLPRIAKNHPVIDTKEQTNDVSPIQGETQETMIGIPKGPFGERNRNTYSKNFEFLVWMHQNGIEIRGKIGIRIPILAQKWGFAIPPK